MNDSSRWELTTLSPDGVKLLSRSSNGWLEAKVFVYADPVDPGSLDIHYWDAPMTYLGNKVMHVLM